MSITQDAKEEFNRIILLSILVILFFTVTEFFHETSTKAKKEAYRTKIQELNNRIKQIELQKQKLLQELKILENQK